MPEKAYKQSFSVNFEYPVCFTRGVFKPDNAVLEETILKAGSGRKHRVMVYIDSGVADAWPNIVKDIAAYFEARRDLFELVALPRIVPGGENAKNGWSLVREIMTELGRRRMCRQSFVVAIGGGSVLDMVGFAASLVHRGLRLIRLPTTVLAQNDAGVGVKNGMNEHSAKNFIGTFSPPWAVIDDFDFLSTLDDRDWRGGISEAFKVAIIKDKDFLDFLCENAEALCARDMPEMEEVVRRCAILHLEHIKTNGDPFEMGSARPLDFGHWAAHRLEIVSDYRIGHGQGVAIGMAVDLYVALELELITGDDFSKVIKGLMDCGLPVWDILLAHRDGKGKLDIVAGLEQFREHLGGELCVTLPDGLGAKVEVHNIDPLIIEKAVARLGEISAGADL